MMTVVCQVDDLKVTHNKSLEVTKSSQYLSTRYEDTLMVHRVKLHDYPDMDMKY